MLRLWRRSSCNHGSGCRRQQRIKTDRDTLLSGSITYLEAISLAEAADSKRSASIGLGVGGALLLGVSVPLIAFLGGLKQ